MLTHIHRYSIDPLLYASPFSISPYSYCPCPIANESMCLAEKRSFFPSKNEFLSEDGVLAFLNILSNKYHKSNIKQLIKVGLKCAGVYSLRPIDIITSHGLGNLIFESFFRQYNFSQLRKIYSSYALSISTDKCNIPRSIVRAAIFSRPFNRGHRLQFRQVYFSFLSNILNYSS